MASIAKVGAAYEGQGQEPNAFNERPVLKGLEGLGLSIQPLMTPLIPLLGCGC